MDFSDALKIVKEGRGIRRGEVETQDSKFVYLSQGEPCGSGKPCRPYLYAIFRAFDDKFGEELVTHIVPWFPTNEDLLANDWVEHFGHD
jgi:hypothetical protein